MAALAAYATSEQGQLLTRIADRWHVDPAAGFTDPIVATNFRLLLMLNAGELAATDDHDAGSRAFEAEWRNA